MFLSICPITFCRRLRTSFIEVQKRHTILTIVDSGVAEAHPTPPKALHGEISCEVITMEHFRIATHFLS